jgi:hypothetical protein
MSHIGEYETNFEIWQQGPQGFLHNRTYPRPGSIHALMVFLHIHC